MKKDSKTIWNERWLGDAGEQSLFVEKVLPLMKDSKVVKVLDLGCGNGYDSVYLAENGFDVTAVDFSHEGLLKLKGRAEERGVGIKSVEQDLSKALPFDDGGFDCVCAHLSLHYFDDETTRRIFGEIYRVLQEGGLVCVKCKSIKDPLCGVGEKVGENLYYKEYLRHFFSEGYMKKVLGDFEIISIESTEHVTWGGESAFVEGVARKR